PAEIRVTDTVAPRVPHHTSYSPGPPPLAPLGPGLGERKGVMRVSVPVLTALAMAFILLAMAPVPARAQGPGGLYGDTLVVATTAVLDSDPLNVSPENGVLHSLVYDSLAVPSASTLVP